jgi:hypothetical protein
MNLEKGGKMKTLLVTAVVSVIYFAVAGAALAASMVEIGRHP